MGLKILYEDGILLVVDKPAGLTIEEIAEQLKTKVSVLQKLGEENRYGVVHRLDKDTSGILLVAKTKEAFVQFQQEFKERKVAKRYICLVGGSPKTDGGVIHTLLARSPADRRKQRTYELSEQKEGRREALTEWKVIERFEGYTLLEVTPKTGRKHQIRAHMASLGFPIAADKLYGFKNQQNPSELSRQFLHASYLRIQDKEFSSELPEDLQKILEDLDPEE